MKSKILMVAVILSIALIGCRRWGVRGNGNVIVEERLLDGFSRVEASGIFYIKIAAGEDYDVKVRAEENLMKYIKIRINEKTLTIYTSRNLSPRKKIQIKISMPELKGIESSGVNKIFAKNLHTKKLSVDLSGAGSITLSGEVNKMRADISGASKLEAGKLRAYKIILDVSGASSAEVNVVDYLNADVSGASKVRYFGAPEKVVTNISGVSSVRKIKE